jgi:hypothetical protein
MGSQVSLKLMMYPATFKGALETLAEEFFEHDRAECTDDMFGAEIF